MADKPTVSVVKGSVDEKALRAQYGDTINYTYGENQFVGNTRHDTNRAYQRYLTNAGVNPINFNVDLDSLTGVPVYEGKLVGGYDEASAIGNIENSLRSSADDYYAIQEALLGQVLNNAFATLGKAYEDAIADGSISVRQAQADFAERKKQLEQQAYAQAEATRVFGNAMGIGNSQQRAGLMAADNARANAGVQDAMSERDKRVADILDRMNAISKQMGLDLSAAQKEHDLGLAQAAKEANMMVNEGLLGLQSDSLQANRQQAFNQENMATQFGYDVGKMELQQQYALEQLDAQQQYALEQMAEAYGYDLSKMSVQQKYALAQMASAYEYDLGKMSAQHGYDMDSLLQSNVYNGNVKLGTFNPSNIPQAYRGWVEDAANKYGLDPAILAGLIETESSWQNGIDNYEGSGAKGLGQFMPNTIRDMKDRLGIVVDVNDAKSSIYATAAYLADRIAVNGGDLNKGIMSYGEGTTEYLNKVLSKANNYRTPYEVVDKDAEATREAMKAYGIVDPYANDANAQLRQAQNTEEASSPALSAYKTGEAEAILNNPALNSTQTTAPVKKNPTGNFFVDLIRNWGYDDKLNNYNAYQEALKKKTEFLESMGITVPK